MSKKISLTASLAEIEDYYNDKNNVTYKKLDDYNEKILKRNQEDAKRILEDIATYASFLPFVELQSVRTVIKTMFKGVPKIG